MSKEWGNRVSVLKVVCQVGGKCLSRLIWRKTGVAVCSDVDNQNHNTRGQKEGGGESNIPLTANPLGFQAWRRFTANADQGKGNNAVPLSQGGRLPSRSKGGQLPNADLEEEVDWSAGVTWTMIAEEMRDMPTMDAEEGETDVDIREVDLDLMKAASKLGRLCKTGVILQALESSPSRDRVVSWVREIMSIRRGVKVLQVKALAKREFLIVFASEEGKGVALAKPPCFMDGKVIRFVEWGNRHKEKLLPHLKAVWVELRDVPPFLEDQASNMLAAIGPVAYQAVDKQAELRYANVRGCILMDLSLELPKKIGLRTPWQKLYLQHITYTRLPDHCFICMQRGHWAKSCPTRQAAGQAAGNREARKETAEETRQDEPTAGQLHRSNSGPAEAAPKEDDFVMVGGRSGSKSPRRRAQGRKTGESSSNRFNILESLAVIEDLVQERDGNELTSRKPVEEHNTFLDAGLAFFERCRAVAEEGDLASRKGADISLAAAVAVVDQEDQKTMKEGHKDSNDGMHEEVKGTLFSPRSVKGKQKIMEEGEDIDMEGCGELKVLQGDVSRASLPLQLNTAEINAVSQPAFSLEGLIQQAADEDILFEQTRQNPFGSSHSLLDTTASPIQNDSLFIAEVADQEGFGRAPLMDLGDAILPTSISNGRHTGKKKGRKNQLKEDTVSKLSPGNIRGASRPSKAKAVKSRLKKIGADAHFIALQEVKVKSWLTHRWLQSISREGRVIFDLPIGSKGGTVLITREGVEVVASGVNGIGRLACV
ncbi:hypothetical protein R1sor_024190 [Riccia sorocarpa]|uniref:CCHC-type domain-containing protein n=1 Tax=Riccia sorocarpa TaxID=122646 RepID=A0ABD3GTT2_9MARC